MAKSIFVSYNFNDRQVSRAVKTMVQEHKEDIHGHLVFVENDVSYNGATAIDWEIEHVMEKCDAALFIIGDPHHNSPWLSREAQHALDKHIPILATSLPGEEDNIPNFLKEEKCTVFCWESDDLYEQMNQC